ncbi:MAG: fatty acid desaturase family protein [Steroidobacteraceae bacterium]
MLTANLDSQPLSTPTPWKPAAGLTAEAKPLGELRPWRSALELGSIWIQIVAALAACFYFASPIAYALTFLFIGARQYGLLILLHDASHTLLHPSRRVNDAIALWLIAAPCGSSFVNSRASHLRHHRHLGDPAGDPDYFLYCSGEPADKASVGAFLWHFAKLISGGQIFHTLFSEQRRDKDSREVKAVDTVLGLVPVAVVQAALLALFALAGHLEAYFLLWVLPLLTLAVFFNGLRVFCDHANVVDRTGASESLLVSYLSNPVERFFVAPFHMNYHAEHHLCPFVPHYNLPRLRALILRSTAHRDQIQWRPGYLKFVAEFLSHGTEARSVAKSEGS